MADTKQQNELLGTAEVIWDLTDLYAGTDDPKVGSDIAWCETEAAAIREAYSGRVKDQGAAELLTLVKRLETLDAALSRLATFSFLNFTTRMTDAGAGALNQKIIELASRCGTQTVFFELEWNQVADPQAEQLLADPELAHYRHYLTSLRRYRPHQLSESEEKILLEKEAVGRNAWTILFNKILSTFKFGASGRTEEEVLNDLYNSRREVRKTAAAEMTAGLAENNHILTHIFNTLAADKMITDRLRRHAGWIDAMNLHNELRNSTVDTLVKAVTSRYDIVHRYYRVKQRLLGLDKLEHYGQAGLPGRADR